METTELLAKILANENLHVRKSRISTAAFDLEKRELILPMWEQMNPIVETMLVEHETGHALFTPLQYTTEVIAKPYLRSVMNVIEDVRIERLFKERYPGSRKDFAAAAKVLRDTDFFEIKGQDLSALNLIDRINVYSKLGVLSGVKFEQKELVFVQRASRTVTFDEVIQLANDVYAFMKEEFQEETRKSQSQDIQFGESADGEGEEIEMDFDADGDTDGDEEFGDDDRDIRSVRSPGSEYQQQSMSAAAEEEYLQSKTDDLLKKKLEEASGVGAEPYYFTLDEDYDTDPVVKYKDVLNRLRGLGTAERFYYDKFKTTVSKQVGHLVQQFELKKAAEVYARRRITKTGYIDVAKISQYKIKDDIFKRNIKVSEGQNHGMIMLLDWSRSMISNNTIHHSLDQVMQLVMFCRSVGIPYRVYAFADREPKYSRYDYNLKVKNHNGDYVNLLEFFSNDMSLADHNEMMSYITSRDILSAYRLTYTPLAPAILAMRKVIPVFKAKYNVQKLNFITFTDGANTSSIVYASKNTGSVYVRDTVLNKNFVVTRNDERDVHINEVNAFYSIIKERFNCTVTTFFVTGNLSIENIRWSGVSTHYLDMLNKIRPTFKSKGFAMITGYGRDAIYFVNSNILKTAELSLCNVTSDMTSSAISRSIKNGAKSSLKNKILIEKFADSIC